MEGVFSQAKAGTEIVTRSLFLIPANGVQCILIVNIDTKDGKKLSVLFVTKDNQKVFTGAELASTLKEQQPVCA